MAKEDFTNLLNKAKETKTETPIQKVIPVKEVQKSEVLFSFSISRNKLKQLKKISAEKEQTLKELINNAIDNTYFNKVTF